MQLMIDKYRLVSLTLLFLIPFSAISASNREQDLSLWLWFQVEKKIGKNQYAEFQYQTRFTENVTRFDRSNIYFIYGIKVLKNLQLETLYQLNTNYLQDQHTFYIGATHKTRLGKKSAIFNRTSFQTVRNYFTGIHQFDESYFEWRNRIRMMYKFNKIFTAAASAEPYLKFSSDRRMHLSRIRLVSQFRVRYNKYQSFTLFYLVQPDIVSFSRPAVDYAMGVTYHLRLPNKAKAYHKLFKSDFQNKKEKKPAFDDTYN